MKVGRNERCPCGSGKKYKHCCIDSTVDVQTPWGLGIQTTCNEKGIDARIGKVFYALLVFLCQAKWTGACHGSSAILYVIYRELGFEPRLCTGMICRDILIAGHSWIELEGEIFDAACYFPAENCPKMAPVFNGIDLGTMKTPYTSYGIATNGFLSDDVQLMLDVGTTVSSVLNGECEHIDGVSLWSVLEYICLHAGFDNILKSSGDFIDATSLMEKYKDIRWTLCDQIPVPANRQL